MASIPLSSAVADPALTAAADEQTARAVARGISRLFARNDIWCLPEMPLRSGRRADLMGIDAKGHVIIVEIKVSRADLLGDGKQFGLPRRFVQRSGQRHQFVEPGLCFGERGRC